MLVRKVWVKYAINIELHFFGYLYIMKNDLPTAVNIIQEHIDKSFISGTVCAIKWQTNFYIL
jgi:hypothetical protein